MKHLKTFENFDLGRFSENEPEHDMMNQPEEMYGAPEGEEECEPCGAEGEEFRTTIQYELSGLLLRFRFGTKIEQMLMSCR